MKYKERARTMPRKSILSSLVARKREAPSDEFLSLSCFLDTFCFFFFKALSCAVRIRFSSSESLASSSVWYSLTASQPASLLSASLIIFCRRLRFLLSSATSSSAFSVCFAAKRSLTSSRVPQSSELKIKLILVSRELQLLCFGYSA